MPAPFVPDHCVMVTSHIDVDVAAKPGGRDQRFPMLYALKPAFVRSLSGVQAQLERRGVSANQLSMAAIPVSAAAGLFLVLGSRFPAAWLVVLPLCIGWMALNALDGSLARHSGQVSRRGAFLNEVADRAGDLFVLTGGFWVAPALLAGVAAGFVVATELVGAVGWAVTGHRVLDGPMAKPDRAMTIGLGAAAATLAPIALPIAYGVVALGAAAGVIVRVRKVWVLGALIDAKEVERS